jgi:phospholipid N-methyltransferase
MQPIDARTMKVRSSEKPAGAALLFVRNFLRHPRMLGSIVPSSRFLVRRLLAQIDWSRARVIVEYGPGVGVVTGQILRNMRPDAVLIVIETNPEFVAFLRSAIVDERLKVVEGSADNVVEILRDFGYTGADYIVSGIPFSTMAPRHEYRAGAGRRICRVSVLNTRAARFASHLSRCAATIRISQRAARASIHLSRCSAVSSGTASWVTAPYRLNLGTC